MKRKPNRTEIQEDIFKQRAVDQTRARLQEIAKERKGSLRAALKKHLRHEMALEVEEGRVDGDVCLRLSSVGEARTEGAELKVASRFKLSVQETLRLVGKPPHYVVHYTYGFHDADTGVRLFRFEYHPFLSGSKGQQNPWSLVHHFHLEDAAKGLARIHFPINPFLDDPVNHPHKVLATIMDWCAHDLAS